MAALRGTLEFPGVSESMFEASRPILLFDHFRVPYEVTRGSTSRVLSELHPSHPLQSSGWLRRAHDESALELLWPACDEATASSNGRARSLARLGSIPIFGQVMDDDTAAGWLAGTGRRWSRSAELVGPSGERLASVWRDEGGSVFLPFDPSEVIENYWSERYQAVVAGGVSSTMKRLGRTGYYRLRPLLPRDLQIWLRRRFSKIQGRTRFPRWPVEHSLHDLFDELFGYVTDLVSEAVPWISPWPDGYSWALVLTHDVETATGCQAVVPLRDVERSRGYRSSWNFVPLRYTVEPALLQELTQDGFEVGVHGLRHDGRDLESLSTLVERLPGIREHAQRWQASGFRAPATQRDWELMPLLGFDYDSSYPDTDPFEPQAGGCCTWLPFFNGSLVELPITLPQDHTLFAILEHRDESLWLEKTRYLRDRGGMALLLTHPDYMRDAASIRLYERYLEQFATDASAWRALPREVAAWWRRRASSHLEPMDGTWQVVGPAAGEARVQFAINERTPVRDTVGVSS